MISRRYLIILLSFFSFASFASTTDSVEVTANITKVVSITGMSDFTLTESGGNLVGNSKACVYSNAAANQYTVKAHIAGETAYKLKDGAKELNFSATWKGVGGTPVNMDYDTPTAAQVGSNKKNCDEDKKGEFAVTVLEAEAEQAEEGTYTATVIVTVAAV